MMNTEEAVNLIIKAIEDGQNGKIYILDMKRPVKIIELAKLLVKNLGRDIPLEITGIRQGEVLEEKLMDVEEERVAVKKDNFFII